MEFKETMDSMIDLCSVDDKKFDAIYNDVKAQALESCRGRAAQRDMLDNMRFLCKGKTEPIPELDGQFNRETHDGKNMSKYSELLGKAIASIIEVKDESDIDSFLGGEQVSFLSNEIKGLDDFELICFLVIRSEG